jgi:RNA-directed DNA polymerase
MPAYNQTTISIIDIPDFSKVPEGVPWVIDTMSLAHSLGIRNRTLMGMIVTRSKLYRRFVIPKKSGGKRTIHAPERKLKFVQARLLDRFFSNITYPDHISAYVPERTTRHSAEKHSGKKILIVIDLKDFFPSTRRAWIRKALQDQFHLPFEVVSAIADVSTVRVDTPVGVRYVVPQGAPTSGAICNWVANHRIDGAILAECQKWSMTYTRYADDLAFSCDKEMPRNETNNFIRAICKIIRKGGYTVNRKKLRVARPGRHQRLLGMTVNEKPNIIRLHYRKLRARIHNCKYKGFDAVAQEMSMASGDLLKSQIEGKISYYHMINPEKAAKLKQQLIDAETYQHGAILHGVHSDPESENT